MHKRIAIVGATGAVGKELISLLIKRGFSLNQLNCFSSDEKTIVTREGELLTSALQSESFQGIDLAFFCVSATLSKEFIPYARKSGATVIDLSSAFRLHESVPLVIPEINLFSIEEKRTIASPNCIVSILLTALFPLHLQAKIKRITAATYQAASGGGKSLMDRLLLETKTYFEGKQSPFPYAFNLFPHESPLLESNYVEEEVKIIQECRKILGESIEVAVTCIRVPVFRAHSIAVFVEFENAINAKSAALLLQKANALTYTEDPSMLNPEYVSQKEKVYCGKIKDDLFRKNTLHLWIVGDQLLKGAALNALQIAENFL